MQSRHRLESSLYQYSLDTELGGDLNSNFAKQLVSLVRSSTQAGVMSKGANDALKAGAAAGRRGKRIQLASNEVK